MAWQFLLSLAWKYWRQTVPSAAPPCVTANPWADLFDVRVQPNLRRHATHLPDIAVGVSNDNINQMLRGAIGVLGGGGS
jgi:hypothetical protein